MFIVVVAVNTLNVARFPSSSEVVKAGFEFWRNLPELVSYFNVLYDKIL